MPTDDDLLKEIQSNFKYQSTQWRDIREDGRKDMLAISGDIWGAQDPNGKKERDGSGRMLISMDELNQYVNPVINDVRQNKRAVKVSPKGQGASEMTAQMRGGMIRQIEYKSKAQAAYLTGFEGAVQRGYGAWKYNTQYISDSAFEQEIVVQRIPNPDVIYMDWNAKEKDFSDGDHAFEVETYRKDAFQKRWPDAKYQSFGNQEMEMAPGWVFGEDSIQVASYWKVKKTTDTLFLLPNNTAVPLSKLKEEFGKVKVKGNFIETESQQPIEFVNRRKTEDRQVCQYITNGLEILEENEWPGKFIPIVYVTGKEIYVDDGSGPKRKLLSMVRLARAPLMAYAYLWTTQLEIVQRMPKMPLIGYEGQFDTTTDWANINKVVTAYAEVKAQTEQSQAVAPGTILPHPIIPSFAVDIQTLAAPIQMCRQAIQAACGVPPGLLEGRGQNADPKSGIALRTLDQQESASNFHFIDNYDTNLEYGGRIMDDLLGPVHDTPRTVGVRNAKGESAVVPINQYHPLSGEKVGFHTDQGEHDITISTGPSFESQRDEVNQFEESLTKTGDPVLTRALLPSIIKNKNLGPLGDEMAAIAEKLSPLNQQQPQVPPQMQLAMQKMSQRLQQLEFERKAKLLEIQGKMQLEQQKQAGKNFEVTQQQSVDLEKTRMNNEAMIDQALAKAGADQQALQYEQMNAQLIKMWEILHEFTQAGLDRQHEKDLSLQEHQQALQQGQQQAQLNPPQPAAPQQ